ncbi:MAG TPA: DUF1501 domain-containing protein [Armatimonadota bacterium]|nr:DUF1501 domain-containing protein [Armatimonadota bacterium]
MITGRGYCDRISRRQALRIGGSGMLAGMSLPALLQMQAEAATKKPAKAQACIFLFLEGGPSTIDMWDLKPDAPSEIRGPYKPIKTNVPGIEVGEHCGLCAKVADKFTILRSHSHTDNGHNTGYHYVMTGYKADFPDGQIRVPNNPVFPSLGSIVSRELGPRTPVPVYVNLPDPMAGGGPGFYGAEHAPFVIESDPVQPDFEVKDLRAADGLSAARLERRKRVLAGLEPGGERAQSRTRAMTKYYEKAYDLITSPEAKKAFDIRSEPDKVRASYGYTSLGQSALMARRLVEAGCRFVGIDHGSWDTHFTCFPSLENDLIPHADRAFSALITDLDERGLLDSTLVVMMGEMGRTPRINAQAGRDHWSMSQSVLLAGGGIKPGQVVGATDKQGAYPTTEPVTVEDLLRTLFHQMGVDASKIAHTQLGRPVPLVNGGKVVRELL